MTIEQKINDIGQAVEALKAMQSDSTKKQDSLLVEQQKTVAEFITKTQEELQSIKLAQAAASRPAPALVENGFGKAGGLLGNIKMGAAWSEERKSELSAYLRKGGNEVEARLMASEAKDFNVINDSNGGIMVAPEMANFMSTIAFETSPLRSLAQVVTTSSDAYEIPLSDQRFGVNRVGELGTVANSSTPQFGLIRVPNFIYESRPRVSQKMLDDAAFDIEGFISQEVADEISRAENTDFFIGDGATRPQGLLTLPNWTGGVYTRGALERVNTGTSAQVTADGLRRLQGAVKEAYQPRATFLMRRSTYAAAMLLKDSQNRYLIGNDLLNGNYMENPTLLGKKVVFCDDVPALGSGSLSALYGDFQRGYVIVDRVGIRVQRDPFTAKPWVEFYTTKRTGGGVKNFDCIKVMVAS